MKYENVKNCKCTDKLKAVLLLIIACSLCLYILSGCGSDNSESQPVQQSVSPTEVSVSEAPSALFEAASQGAAVILDATKTTSDNSNNKAPNKNKKNDTIPNSTKYCIVVYTGSQSTVVYEKDKNGEYSKIVKRFTCSTGANSSPTKTGNYKVIAKYRWRLLVNNVYGQYSTSIGNNYLFHSVPYLKKDASSLDNAEYDKLGSPASHGCIRMCVRDCRWIYNNIPMGTSVKVTNDRGPAGVSIPQRNPAGVFNGWDPSDQWSKGNPYFSANVTCTYTSQATTASTTNTTNKTDKPTTEASTTTISTSAETEPTENPTLGEDNAAEADS